MLRSIFNILSGFSPLCLAKPLFQYSDAERRIQLGSRQFHYTESSCFSSGSRPLCRLPGTQNWKHGTNNIMCYSNFAPGLVICPSAVTSVADRADVPASLPVFPRHLSLKLSRLHNRPAIEALTALLLLFTKKKESQFVAVMFLCRDVFTMRTSLQWALWVHSSMMISVITTVCAQTSY